LDPFFVARPEGKAEEDGVVILLVSDKHVEGFTLVLDGSMFTEITKEKKIQYGLPYGLHGCWVPFR
jgi:carlactone synthase/all-trans-10'-apo-beta-carotenal 13,14-cleaving dioxygenase